MYNQKENRSVDWDKVFIISTYKLALRANLSTYHVTWWFFPNQSVRQWVFVQRIENTQKIWKHYSRTICVLPAAFRVEIAAGLLVFKTQRAISNASHASDWTQVACLCQGRQQQDLCPLRGGCKTTIGDKIFKNILFFLERDRYEERSKSHFKHL